MLMEAADLTADPVRKRYATLYCFLVHGYFLPWSRPSTLAARRELEESWGGEASLVAAIEDYQVSEKGGVRGGAQILKFNVASLTPLPSPLSSQWLRLWCPTTVRSVGI